MENDEERQEAFVTLFRSFIQQTHQDYENCSIDAKAEPHLPLFYPHHGYLRNPVKKTSGVPMITSVKKKPKAGSGVRKFQEDTTNSYSKSLLSVLGTFFFLVDSAKQGNGLLSFILQKKLHMPIQQTGHKNYAVSLLAYKHTVLGHQNAQFAHQYMWNCVAGRRGKGNKFPRDQKVEHVNRFLKDSFRSLGPNLNTVTAKRVNNSSDFALKVEEKLSTFFGLSESGRSHSQKDHSYQVKKISSVLKKENIAEVKPGRKFKGPKVQANFFDSFDQVKFRTWHLSKDKELYRSSSIYRNSQVY